MENYPEIIPIISPYLELCNIWRYSGEDNPVLASKGNGTTVFVKYNF